MGVGWEGVGRRQSEILNRVDRESLFEMVILEQRNEEVGPMALWGIVGWSPSGLT